MSNFIPSEDQIARYLAGEATSQEAEEVLQWSQESEANENSLEEYRKTWDLIDYKSKADVNIDAAWIKMKVRMQDSESKKEPQQAKVVPMKKSNTSVFLRIAAGFILVFGLGSLLFYLNKGENLMTITAEKTSKEVYLPDSTFVLLAPNSTLTYNTSDYGKSERNTDLTGEATYSVKKNSASPFLVNVGKAEVLVLGTSFRIREGNIDESVEVAVITGKVKLSVKKEPFGQNKTAETILLPGMQGLMDGKSGEIAVDTVSVEEIRYKLNNTLVFEQTELKEVCRTLSSVFGKQINLGAESLNNCMLTATFKNQKLPEILTIIAGTFGLTLSEESNMYILDGQGCL
jgi:transmembrane sensor